MIGFFLDYSSIILFVFTNDVIFFFISLSIKFYTSHLHPTIQDNEM